MKLQIFAIHDSKANAFIPPFISKEIETAKRTFANAANDKLHQFGANPADYTLFHLGTFNDENAEIEIIQTPQSYGLAIEYIKKEKATGQLEMVIPGSEAFMARGLAQSS